MKIIGVIQARMSSTRLPGKVMLKILDKPILWHIHNRLNHCKSLQSVVISTGEYDTNKEICEFAKQNSILFYSGSETDLIDRLYNTAISFQSSAIVRITADCPFVDPELVDRLVHEFVKKNEYDIVTNCRIRTFPHGLDIEVYSIDVLKKLWEEIKEPSLREWFPIYVIKNSQMFRMLDITNPLNLSNLRWTVDYPEDYEFVKHVYSHLYQKTQPFLMNDILDLLKIHPKLKEINAKYADHHNVGAPTFY